MRFLATSIIRAPERIAEIPQHYAAEAEQVSRLLGDGSMREIYFDAGAATAYVIVDAADAAAARAALATLPLVECGILDWSLATLQPLPELADYFAQRAIAPPAWWPAGSNPSAISP
ncbi:hypothetical protein WPS_12480 [Vulcanimicrobium alpinum]|uniref:Muconolactone isomerase domain-containing protein n=1 Tax=Vulcanimicrobium alpinum TaxID=3016050 RepID=A0AAN1XV28_UNVUL|nr:muconolactone Delta-isomerase family protein [Vulcanimicrobium alpinum]BDE05972.1 hypothetical protein WPS_12480 [Vulcanimicrobium alpinum]